MKKTLIFAALVALMTGCSPYTLVNSETYNNVQLQDYKTFRIVTPDEGHLPPGMEMVTYYNIAAAIREQLVDRGFTEDPTSPVLVNIGLTVKKEIATEPAIPPGAIAPGPAIPPPPPVRPGVPGVPPPPPGGPWYNGYGPVFMYPRSYYWNYYSNAQIITGIYREGVLTMDMVDIQQKLPLFSASVATIMGNGNGQFRNLEGIAQAVQTLFSKFPVPLLPQYRK